MKLVVGLGNPDKEYEETRHNIGFKAIDLFSHRINVELTHEKFNSKFYKSKEFILAKPLTYMNLSGDFVLKITRFYKIPVENILIIYDEIDLPIGELRYRLKGSSNGHKGMTDIIHKMKTHSIPRLRIGVGRPKKNVERYVLSAFTKLQINILNSKKENIITIINDFLGT